MKQDWSHNEKRPADKFDNMKWISSTLIFIFFVLGFTPLVYARERHEFYNGVRCLGMGGACIAVTNDETALAVNPAALGKLRDFYGTVFDPEIELTEKFLNFNQSSSISNPWELSAIKGALDARKGEYYYSRLQLMPSFVGKNFGIGFLGNYTLAAVESADGSTIDTFYRNDMAFLLGYNLRFFDGRVKIGFNAKLISRIELDEEALSSASSMSLSSNPATTEGVGLSTDAALVLAAPWEWIPTLAVVARDVGGTAFDKSSGLRMTTASRPDTVKQTVDAAVALFPIHNKGVRSSWTVEMRDVLNAYQIDNTNKNYHAGFELNFNDVAFVRAGYNQMKYWTAGLELASEKFQFQFATYGEEIGDGSTSKENRRTIMKFALRF